MDERDAADAGDGDEGGDDASADAAGNAERAVREAHADRDNPFERVVAPWEQVVEDMATTAEEYREEGYDVVELHPGDVTPLADGRMDVLVPNNEFDRLRETVTDAMTEVRVFRAQEGDVVFALAVVTDPDAAVAVCCPVYYAPGSDDDGAFADTVTAEGRVTLSVRALGENPVEVTCDDPALFLPDTGDED